MDLIIPAIEQSASMGKLSFLPAAIGFWIGILFLLLLDHIIPHLHQNSDQAEGPKSKLQRTTMMILAVTLHNIPEGMAVKVSSTPVISLKLHNHHLRRCTGIIPLASLSRILEGRHHIHAPSRRRYEEAKPLWAVSLGIVEPVGGILTFWLPIILFRPALSAEFSPPALLPMLSWKSCPRNVPGFL